MTILRMKLLPLFCAAWTWLFAADNSAVKAGLDGERLARIPKRMNEFVQNHDLAGVVTLVARHDGIFLVQDSAGGAGAAHSTFMVMAAASIAD